MPCTKLHLTVITCSGAGLLTAAVFFLMTATGCDLISGKWASRENHCVTSACYWTSGCGIWKAPAARCDKVKPGDMRAAVYFQLGEPYTVHRDASTVKWPADKGAGEIEARFEGDELVSLSCPGRPDA